MMARDGGAAGKPGLDSGDWTGFLLTLSGITLTCDYFHLGYSIIWGTQVLTATMLTI